VERVLEFCNIKFNLLHKNELFDLSQDEKLLPKIIITVNAEFIWFANTNKRFMHIVNNNYVTFDGTVPYKTAKKTLKNKNIEKLSGSDIFYDFCQFAKVNKSRIFLLGSTNDVNTRAVEKLRENYSIDVNGFSPPLETYPFSDNFNKISLEKISEYKPDILFVGFGMPKQEYWADDNKTKLRDMGVKYVIGCGGTINFVGEKTKRAPRFIQYMGLEFLYRFIQEPDMTRLIRIINAGKFYKYINHKPDFE
jgi:N-acetylglucosaminyldiphosphoundecaprenol N-acetyl-beta-D-mannosaminyltransferase